MGRLFSDDWGHPVGPIVIEGPSGIGKTALIGAACQIASDSGWAVLKARGDHCRGSIARPLTDKELEEKFLMQAKGVIADAAARGLIDLCWKIEELGDVGAEVRKILPVA